MTLYHFNPNTYGQQWFVMAESREAAITAVKAKARQDALNGLWPDVSDEVRADAVAEALAEVDRYVNKSKDDWEDKAPCIEVYGPGQVIASEIC